MGGAVGVARIGTFSVGESLTQGVTLVYRCPRLLVPFILAALAGASVHLLVLVGAGNLGHGLLGVQFASGVVSFLVSSWGTWLVIWRYREQGIARLDGGPEIGGYRHFLTGDNPMLPGILLLSLTIQSISLARGLLNLLLGSSGLYFLSLGIWAIFWLIQLFLTFSIFGIMIHRLSALEAMRQSREIVARNIMVAVGLWVGLWIIGYVAGMIFSLLLSPLMMIFSGLGPIQFTAISPLLSSPLSGFVGAVRSSCTCFAFLSVFGRVDSVAVAVKHGKALPDCPGSPELPRCLGCRELQDFGDKYYCTRFGVAVRKEGEQTASGTK